MNPFGVSKAYHAAIQEATQHHLRSKTYSGLFLRPHAARIKEIIDRLKIRSILDYGCGKGRQYEWVSHDDATGTPKGYTLEQFWGVTVRRYDPCWPPFAEAPEGRFDLVLCTHVLGSIPAPDFQAVKWNIYRYALKAVYFAEKLGPIGKKVFTAPEGMATARFSHGEYAAALCPTGRRDLEVWLCTRSQSNAVLTREQLRA